MANETTHADLLIPAAPGSGTTAAPGGLSEQTGSPGVRRTILAGFSVIALFFGGLGTWSALAPLESAAMALGAVSVDTNRKTIQHLEGGIVREILVRDGDVVAAGQPLIRLDETQARATLDLLKGRQLAATALEARLIAERDGKEEIEFSDWPARREAVGEAQEVRLVDRLQNKHHRLLDDLVFLADDAQGPFRAIRLRDVSPSLEDPRVAEIIDGQINIFKARRKALLGQVAIQEKQMAQISEEIKGLEGQIKAEDFQLRLVRGQIEDLRGLVERKVVTKPRMVALQRGAAEIEGSRSQNRARIARARQSIGEAKLRINDLRARLINEVVLELRDVQSELFDLAERIRVTEDVLWRTAIRAPLTGTIVGLQVHTLGGVIGPGEPLLDIVPSGDRLVIEAQINPRDIDVVHPGLVTQVRLMPFSMRNTAPLEGRVTSVSADRLTDERTGQSYYLARIALNEDPAIALGGASLYPGMPAEVMFVTGTHTALGYIFKPITASLNRAFREE